MLSDESLRRDGLSRPPAAGGPATAPHARPVWPLALTAALVAALIAVPAFAGSPHWLGRLSQVVTGSPLRPEHEIGRAHV